MQTNHDEKNSQESLMSEIRSIANELESKPAREILKWGFKKYKDKMVLGSSFGAEDVVLIDMMCNINRNLTRVFTLDTGRLNQETYDLIDKIRKKYDIKVDVYFPNASDVEEMVAIKGMNLMYESVENRKLCCNLRKVEPLKRALKQFDCWITGLRREQSTTRNKILKIEVDTLNSNIIKLNPLANWTNDEIWKYIRENKVPYNELHDRGYPSIGCEPCTRAIKEGEDPRAGRWWWENDTHKECGLHWKEGK
ncbi:MAG TPA: phosphoadenylyl-sulfate reductase [Nitrososphaeraceae archaeon]|nr:phosphoadenylyl-sulfate reductase [Nitrososphaeraceae archaeon]HZO11049.1 phosphoadenylyl-sulfate reductase [Nitrososphaeraceae archaeon]